MFDKGYHIISDEIKELLKEKAKVIWKGQLAESCDQRMQDMEIYMKKVRCLKKEFDDEPVRRLLRIVKVINETR